MGFYGSNGACGAGEREGLLFLILLQVLHQLTLIELYLHVEAFPLGAFGTLQAVAGGRLGDIGHAVQSYCEARGYGVVREYTGHGVGTEMHEDPSVPNYGTPGRGVRLLPGMVIAIEPMINEGTHAIRNMPDGWTVKTRDGKLSAHFEHTVAITADGPKILTKV